MKHRQSALALSRVAQRRFEGSKATATLEGQAERHAADLTRCFPFLFAPFFLGFPLHRKCTRVFHFEPIGGAPGTLGGILH